MLDDKQKKSIRNRLSRIRGQLGGVSKMVETDRYCLDILNQTSAVVAAIRNVENIVLQNHLDTCVADAIRSENLTEQTEKQKEIMSMLGTYRR